MAHFLFSISYAHKKHAWLMVLLWWTSEHDSYQLPRFGRAGVLDCNEANLFLEQKSFKFAPREVGEQCFFLNQLEAI